MALNFAILLEEYMKKLLLLAFLSSTLNYGMEDNDDREVFKKYFYDQYGYTSYNGEIGKKFLKGTPMGETFKRIIAEFSNQILDTQFDGSIKEFCENNPKDEHVKVIKRWTKAVSFKILKYYGNPELIAGNFDEMIRAVPLDTTELFYIKGVCPDYGMICGKLNQHFYSSQMQNIFESSKNAIYKKLLTTKDIQEN